MSSAVHFPGVVTTERAGPFPATRLHSDFVSRRRANLPGPLDASSDRVIPACLCGASGRLQCQMLSTKPSAVTSEGLLGAAAGSLERVRGGFINRSISS